MIVQTGRTATDSLTGRIWQQGSSSESVDYVGAKAYCESLVLGGFSSGWRLPTARELQSIVDESSGPPLIEVEVFTAVSQHYWASTPSVASDPNKAWVVSFAEGDSGVIAKHDTSFIRCVR